MAAPDVCPIDARHVKRVRGGAISGCCGGARVPRPRTVRGPGLTGETGGDVNSQPFRKIKGLMTGNVYIVEGDELVIVDTGAPTDFRIIERQVKRLGRSVEDIGHIFITHFHVDHAGAAAALKEASGARVYAHEADAPILAGEEKVQSVYRTGVIGRVASAVPGVSERMAKVPPVRVDVPLKDGDVVPVLGGMRLIHAPGHTPGNSCYLWEERGVLFSGDAIINTYHVLTLPTMGFSCDFDLAARSARSVARRVADEDLQAVCPGHGPVVDEDIGGKLERMGRRAGRRLGP